MPSRYIHYKAYKASDDACMPTKSHVFYSTEKTKTAFDKKNYSVIIEWKDDILLIGLYTSPN